MDERSELTQSALRPVPLAAHIFYDGELLEIWRHGISSDYLETVEPGEPESGTLPRECPPASAPGSTLDAEARLRGDTPISTRQGWPSVRKGGCHPRTSLPLVPEGGA